MTINAPCKIGDTIGYIAKYARDENPYALIEAKVTSIKLTKYGLKVYAPRKFRPLYAEDIDHATSIMDGDELILIQEPFVLKDTNRARVERWVKWANENPGKVKSILE